MNSIVIAGNLGRDAEQREVSGQSVVSFSVAVRRYKKEEPQWFRVSLWGTYGEKLQPYLTKGTRVSVQGEVDARIYTTTDGETKLSLDIRGQNVSLLGGGERTEQAEKPAEENQFNTDVEDDSIPF